MTDRKPPQPSSQTEPSIDLSQQVSETVLDAPGSPAPRAARPRQPSGTRAAAPVASSDTVLLDTGAPAKDSSTFIFDTASGPSRASLAVDDAATDARSLAADDRPTAAKRPLADLVDDREVESTSEIRPESTVLGDKARGERGAQFLVAALLLLLGLGLGLKLLISRTRTPSRRDLVLLYPFGLGGGTQPNGRRAPGYSGVEFKLMRTEDCGGDRCLTYLAHTPDGSFQYQMTVRDDDGVWTYVSSGPPGGR